VISLQTSEAKKKEKGDTKEEVKEMGERPKKMNNFKMKNFRI